MDPFQLWALPVHVTLTDDRPHLRGHPAANDYVGVKWRLLLVTRGTTSTAIPTDSGAGMQFSTRGTVVIHDGVNTLSGTFTTTADGFELHEVATTLVGYEGNDPGRLAAITALSTLAYGHPGGSPGQDPVRARVLSVQGDRLVVAAGAYRLTFQRAGTATLSPSTATLSPSTATSAVGTSATTEPPGMVPGGLPGQSTAPSR